MTLKIAKPSASGLKIAKPSGSKLRLTSTFSYDTDAAAYITAVEAADGQTLETATRYAINNFVIGCKQDGIWSAIKASCILAGARTLSGALVPLAGVAPTNNNFVSGDYSRKTGLAGNGSNKFLGCNRNNNADSQDSKHISIYASSYGNATGHLISSSGGVGAGDSHLYVVAGTSTKYIRLNSSGFLQYDATTTFPFMGASRSASNGFNAIINNSILFATATSNTPRNVDMQLLSNSNARIAFYSIGESISLVSLSARVTALINAIGAAF